MNNYNKLLNNLETLNLLQIKNNIDNYIDLINNKKKDFVESMYELTNLEMTLKQERAINACVKVANFPFLKTLDDFDFSFQLSINKQEFLDLTTLRFINNTENILLVGTSGVGKTHLATAIGMECAKHRYSTYFISFQELMNQLQKALKENRLESRMKFFAKYKILIIDELGYLPVD